MMVMVSYPLSYSVIVYVYVSSQKSKKSKKIARSRDASIGKKKSVRIEKKDSIMKTVTKVKDELVETKKMIEDILKEEDRARERREDVRKIKRRARDTASELIETATQKQIAEINKSFQIRKTALQKKLIS